MKQQIISFFVAILLINFVYSQSSWAIIDNDFETIALANSFYADNNGFVAGGSASGDPLLLLTTDGGVTFNNTNLIGNNHAAFLSIDMYDSQNGVAGALGFFGIFACGAYTHDGQNWNSTSDDLICAIQDCQAIDENNLVMIGDWSDLKDFQGNGVQLSTDGGKRWSQNNWNQGTDNDARYAWFASSDLGYVAGGAFPTFTEESEDIHHLSRHVLFNKKTGKYEFNRRGSRAVDGYNAILASASNGASQYTTLLNFTNDGIYFNEISCTDQNNCWVCAEGIDKSTAADVAYIYHTNDGWQTYDIQLTVPGGSLITVSMLNSTFGWAGGALLESTEAGFEGQFWLTQDGATWTLNSELKNFYAFYLSTTSAGYAYASGITPIGLSSFASYSPSN